MSLDQIRNAPLDTDFIAGSSLAVTQWESVLADSDALEPNDAERSRPIFSFDAWLARQWEDARFRGSPQHDLCLLNRDQSTRLWRSVIDDSPESAALISTRGVAHWAAQARRSLLEWGVAPGDLDPNRWRGDSACFLRWHRGFELLLQQHQWIDPDGLLYELNRRPLQAGSRDLLLLDPARETPERQRFERQWLAAGRRMTRLTFASAGAASRQLTFPNPESELRAVADWACEQLERNGTARVAVVIPDIGARRDTVAQVLGETVGHSLISWESGRAIGQIGAFGAALTALRLLSPGANFAVLSRWLRSPFFGHDDDQVPGAAALFERSLRQDPRSQQGFLQAFRRYGLREMMLQSLPHVVARLDEALGRLPRNATPTGWMSIWQACLRTLGWQGLTLDLPGPMIDAWERACARFAALTTVTGQLPMDQALDEFQQLVATQTVYEPMRLRGVHVLSRMEQVGPGYSGAWIGGFTDQRWPEPPEPNPLVPWPVQAEHAVPSVDAAGRMRQAEADLHRLLLRVPLAVFSCPLRNLDQPQLPNPRFDSWIPMDATPERRAGSVPVRDRIGARDRRIWHDGAPPFAGNRIPGGTGTLDLQSACPVKAFGVARLGARELEIPMRGIDARLRGIAVHRALELLMHPRATGDLRDRIISSIAAAADELFPQGNDSWQIQVAAERRRIERILERLLDIENRRAPFTVEAVEQRRDVEIAGLQVPCRIDRLDRLNSGDALLIDYKTGRSMAGGWFDDRLGDCQLPTYAQDVGTRLAAITVIGLRDDDIEFQGAGRLDDGLPGKHRHFSEGEWLQQLLRWSEQLDVLVKEFAAGDVRVRVDSAELAEGPFGSLTRIRSVLG